MMAIYVFKRYLNPLCILWVDTSFKNPQNIVYRSFYYPWVSPITVIFDIFEVERVNTVHDMF